MLKRIKYLLLVAPGMVLATGAPGQDIVENGNLGVTVPPPVVDPPSADPPSATGGFNVPGTGSLDYGTVATTPQALITNALTFLFWAVGLVSLVFLVVGAFTYVTSQGNEDSIDKAKKTILYAIIGVVVALLAIVVLNYLKSTLETGAVPTL